MMISLSPLSLAALISQTPSYKVQFATSRQVNLDGAKLFLPAHLQQTYQVSLVSPQLPRSSQLCEPPSAHSSQDQVSSVSHHQLTAPEIKSALSQEERAVSAGAGQGTLVFRETQRRSTLERSIQTLVCCHPEYFEKRRHSHVFRQMAFTILSILINRHHNSFWETPVNFNGVGEYDFLASFNLPRISFALMKQHPGRVSNEDLEKSKLRPQSLVTWCRVVYTRIVSINVHLSDNDRTLPTVWPILARYEPRYSPEMGRETRRKLKLNLITGGLFPPRGCRATFIEKHQQPRKAPLFILCPSPTPHSLHHNYHQPSSYCIHLQHHMTSTTITINPLHTVSITNTT
ncbi:hypothetical protein RRG08_060975 [Elysia crispata]|uniref:Uncharacterized protein n=1 Tax=Elysia crispata TaxID=231223 RepID=A0AAE1AV21_9GAST|nr:hypothetical protein RRG08_060975 [Elysia crispata]